MKEIEIDAEVARWTDELDEAEKYFSKWKDRCKEILRRYRDEKTEIENTTAKSYRFPLFWSNIQIQKPAYYSRTPKPEVERKFKDQDRLGREAGEVLERAIDTVIKEQPFDDMMTMTVEDFLLYARGQGRVRFKSDVAIQKTVGQEEEAKPTGENPETQEQVLNENVLIEYVHWDDFLHSPARSWLEVRWVAFRACLTKGEAIARFGKEIAAQLTYDKSYDNEENQGSADAPKNNKTEIWEIWEIS